ncbi:MAG: response regulator transcription factor [Chitinophagaceae bacterium]|nr:response regulator transcription factor [Chitinophagaceae bacterium]
MKKDKITLALVDDHQIVIDGLTALLKGHDKFQFAFATTNSSEVVELIDDNPVDVLLTDVMMPKLPGNELAKQVKKNIPV